MHKIWIVTKKTYVIPNLQKKNIYQIRMKKKLSFMSLKICPRLSRVPCFLSIRLEFSSKSTHFFIFCNRENKLLTSLSKNNAVLELIGMPGYEYRPEDW